MKLWQILGGAALSVTLAGCADQGKTVPTPTANTPATVEQAAAIRQPAVTGIVSIRQSVALPPNSVLTVTLSDASISDTPSTVISQKVMRTEGKQAPFSFVLPFNPAQIQPNARILLSAAITIDGRLMFITEQVKMVVTNGNTTQDLILVPVPAVAMPTRTVATSTTAPMTSPTPVTSSGSAY
ncbi:YbaY family lipoprotein [Acerihabitans sp. TG2]|uniref:YbaY family lipoprotein n=1 Tax=Acerihabitans sp. TG2 TaxID=3096008 RepID=UPI002B23B854|nr:YbaY family lipoprotein [Acerihabitans sp. TG2]MEA9390818.1 YbaY family lipoprotein [Acerihabitans sp. TG2]